MDLSKYASRDCNGSGLGDTAATMAASTASTSATALVAAADVGSCDKAVASFNRYGWLRKLTIGFRDGRWGLSHLCIAFVLRMVESAKRRKHCYFD